MTKGCILVVEDDISQRDMLLYNLIESGYDTLSASDGEECLFMARERHPDLILMDWMLPNLSGFESCRRLKSEKTTSSIPIILLTARGEEYDRVRGLDQGADDYIVKPYSIAELLARIRACLRRGVSSRGASTPLTFADVIMNEESHTVTRAGKELKLGPIEFRLLQSFLQYPTRVWSRSRLLDRVWGLDCDSEERTVDVHIRRLRKVLNGHSNKDLIRTVRGEGYSLIISD